ncbi:uncharacterized protein F5147DRAFT_773845 [Suillus discolor]|uniref:Uncharacterized protein n=1 Tax=Suillus discolor TaxID=1912936 RepID=A0A9P7JU11_9AGAM|nr:uncharacterized protein F5147DRAFT_773845 [Suillus discolor]KAG2108261.1 hypothetical protein F5147DRAFT_773845 [Suillus discolor]
MKAISAINSKSGAGPCVRGLVICCGSTGRLSESANLLNRFIERDVFDFVLTFAGVSTIDSIVVPALNRFIENVYVFDMHIWDAMEESFGEDRYALNQSPMYISFATITNGPNGERNHIVDARVLAYSNLKDGCPWGLDIYRCWNVQCQAPAYNMIFHVHGKQFFGQRWVEMKLKYMCLQCKMMQKGITCPSWVHAARSQNYGHVWYQWPLTSAQRHEIGVIQ